MVNELENFLRLAEMAMEEMIESMYNIDSHEEQLFFQRLSRMQQKLAYIAEYSEVVN